MYQHTEVTMPQINMISNTGAIFQSLAWPDWGSNYRPSILGANALRTIGTSLERMAMVPNRNKMSTRITDNDIQSFTIQKILKIVCLYIYGNFVCILISIMGHCDLHFSLHWLWLGGGICMLYKHDLVFNMSCCLYQKLNFKVQGNYRKQWHTEQLRFLLLVPISYYLPNFWSKGVYSCRLLTYFSQPWFVNWYLPMKNTCL